MKIILFCLLFTAAKFTAAQQKPPVKTITKNGYSITYPNKWAADSSGKMGADLYIFSEKENEQDRFRENINVLIQNLSGMGIDLDRYVQLSIDQIKSLLPGSKIFETKRMSTASKRPYHKIIYSMNQQGFELMVEQYYFVNANKAYVVTYTAEVTRFEQYKQSAEQILNSFSLKN
ncbi:MAG: hypothetical protein RL172_2542 [Bacteroidota bacterium]|jgi:hypothetical protein